MNRSNTARTTALIAIISGFLAISAVAPGFLDITATAFAADDATAIPQGQLNMAGTDFTSTKSVNHLKSRLHRVAWDICMPSRAVGELPNIDERKCVDAAMASGITQIDARQQLAMRSTLVNVASATETPPTAIHPAH